MGVESCGMILAAGDKEVEIPFINNIKIGNSVC
jgi:tRNA-binding EMAP/Myf-like protein